MYVDHRAIVVHHHLGQGRIPTIRSEREAQAFIKSMVERIWSRSETDDTAATLEKSEPFGIPTPVDRAESLRVQLCASEPVVRILAAVELAQAGTLDDIGLLSDLLSLPPLADEHPRERAALVHAMQRLSGVATEPFDLSGVVPPPQTKGKKRRGKNPRLGPPPAPESVGQTPPPVEPPDWKCPKCGAEVPECFEICWACGTSRDGTEDPTFHGLEEE
jgi:hypothetical protein